MNDVHHYEIIRKKLFQYQNSFVYIINYLEDIP